MKLKEIKEALEKESKQELTVEELANKLAEIKKQKESLEGTRKAIKRAQDFCTECPLPDEYYDAMDEAYMVIVEYMDILAMQEHEIRLRK